MISSGELAVHYDIRKYRHAHILISHVKLHYVETITASTSAIYKITKLCSKTLGSLLFDKLICAYKHNY